METLRLVLNRELFLGLAEFEAQYAHYPAGAFYRTHVDRHRDSGARVISTVFYLNADWPAEAGGELVMYDADGRERFRQQPAGGTLLLFRSDDMPHEVLAATRARWSIAGWFRSRG
jgi:SM-20-related protein